jgi:Tfp pilus assembly protein PilV
LLIGIGILALSSLNLRVNTSTQNASEGQCQSNSQNFDARQEALTLAQAAEQYRHSKPFAGNYGLGSYTMCYSDASQQRLQSPVFKGYENLTDPGQPRNATHSEQSSYGWLQLQLSRISVNQSTTTAIYAVIFSQVIVCLPCRKDMVSWQKVLRQKAKTNNLYLSIWDIAPGKGFIPTVNPAGTGIPITIGDLERIHIQFAL